MPKVQPVPLAEFARSTALIRGYASRFDVADAAGDVVAPGAFAASLARRGAAGIRMLWQHDPREPVGVWQSIVETAEGLLVRGRLNLQVQRGRELAALIADGAVDGLSIGFRVERARSDPRRGQRRLERLDLWEVSLVTFPMLSGARVFAVERAASSPADGVTGRGLAGTIRRTAAIFRG
jgi:hypothetical protein